MPLPKGDVHKKKEIVQVRFHTLQAVRRAFIRATLTRKTRRMLRCTTSTLPTRGRREGKT